MHLDDYISEINDLLDETASNLKMNKSEKTNFKNTFGQKFFTSIKKETDKYEGKEIPQDVFDNLIDTSIEKALKKLRDEISKEAPEMALKIDELIAKK